MRCSNKNANAATEMHCHLRLNGTTKRKNRRVKIGLFPLAAVEKKSSRPRATLTLDWGSEVSRPANNCVRVCEFPIKYEIFWSVSERPFYFRSSPSRPIEFGSWTASSTKKCWNSLHSIRLKFLSNDWNWLGWSVGQCRPLLFFIFSRDRAKTTNSHDKRVSPSCSCRLACKWRYVQLEST